MSESSKVTSEHFVSAYMESDDEESCLSGREYTFDELSIYERESSADSHLEEEKEESNPSGQISRRIILPRIWSINVFLVSMTKVVFSRLRPCFQIPDNIPIRKAIKGEKCYIGRSSKVGFYEVAFIMRLRFPLSHLYHRLADYLGIFVSQIAPNAWRIFIGAEVL